MCYFQPTISDQIELKTAAIESMYEVIPDLKGVNNLATINVSIFDKSINFSKLPDDMTRKVIREYFLTRTDYKNPSLDLQSLCRVYPDKSICDLTPTILRDTVETWSKAGIRKNFCITINLCGTK